MFRHQRQSPSSQSSRTTTPELDMLGSRGYDTATGTETGTETPTIATSIYSEGLTEIPNLPLNYNGYNVKEGKLIDYDQEHSDQDEDVEGNGDGGMIQNPTEKLRELLKQMKSEIEITKPPIQEERQVQQRVIGEKRDWRRNLIQTRDVGASRAGLEQTKRPYDAENEYENEQQDKHQEEEEEEDQGEDQEEEQESPPTPPPRIGNPYAARRGDRRSSPNLSQPGRLPSRAAVLLNSTSRSPPSPEAPNPPNPEIKSPPTRLEAFLASSTSSLPPPPPLPSTSSYPAESSTRQQSYLQRRDSGSSTSSYSRKGKNRAISPIIPIEQTTSISRRERYRQTPPPSDIPQDLNTRRRIHTPRRISIDLAPEDLNSFARNAVDLEVRGEVELDLDEGLSGLGWEESSQSLIDSPPRPSDLRRSISKSPELILEERRERGSTYKPRSSSPLLQQETNIRYSHNPSSHTRPLSRNRTTPPRTSSPPIPSTRSSSSPTLPALPEPDISANSDISEIDTYSSRRAALFRSTSKSASTSNSTVKDKSQSKSPSTSYGTPIGSRSRVSNRNSVERDEEEVPSQIGGRSRILNRNSVERDSEEEELPSTSGARPTISNRHSMEREEEFPSKQNILPDRIRDNRSAFPLDRHQTQIVKETPPRLPQSAEQSSPPVESSLRTSPSTRPSTPYTPPRKEEITIPPQNPIQVNIALTPPSTSYPSNLTPVKSSNPNLSTMPTPKPPGAWQSTPKSKVRFNPSPLGKSSPIKGDISSQSKQSERSERSIQSVQSEEGVSVHRLRISPRRSPKSKLLSKHETKEKDDDVDVGNNSFLGKLAESISSPLKRVKLSIPIPPKSTTFTRSTPTLEQAKFATSAAEEKLALTQKQWLEALQIINAAASSSGVNMNVGSVVKKSWNWSTWLLWGLVEIIVLWSVFRVTIDYATSLTHLSALDPFHPLALPFRQSSNTQIWGNGPFGVSNPIKLDITIPSALQTLVGDGNLNFFDLVESWGIWNKFGGSVGGGGRVLGGIPT